MTFIENAVTACVNSPAYLGTKADFVDWDEWVINKVVCKIVEELCNKSIVLIVVK
jgi:hypothetical protein